ncbi:hypothetical protein JCM39068_05130 [Desulfocastanea catecholica]
MRRQPEREQKKTPAGEAPTGVKQLFSYVFIPSWHSAFNLSDHDHHTEDECHAKNNAVHGR